jgi:L-cystine uptake protein TcyP (sodium:dicarboxylate symporter family)
MFKRIDKISNEEWIGIVLIAAVIGVVFFKVLEKTDHKKTVLSDYSITTGSIIEYRIWEMDQILV